MSWRLQNNPKRPDRYEGVAEYHFEQRDDGPLHCLRWTGRVNLDWDALEIPYRWKKPRTVFVASMSDLFREKVPIRFILQVFKVMRDNPDHTFLILTKRAGRMKRFIDGLLYTKAMPFAYAWRLEWPFPNVWLGVTAENQEQADKRIPLLLQTPAAVRWVSCEPLLTPIDLNRPTWLYGAYDDPEAKRINWVVVGCESGPNRRPFSHEDAIDLVRQCDDAQIPVFVKQVQLGNDRYVSKDPGEWHRDAQHEGLESLNLWSWPDELGREWPR